MPIELRHMRCFIAVAEDLHFRRAAERLGIAQPALSRTIRDLENELGSVLLIRSNRSVRITNAGSVFLEGCRTIVASVDHAIDEARRVHTGKIGSLRIGYTDNAIAGRLPGLMRDFLKREPGISLYPTHSVTVSQLDMLDQETLDIGFVTGPISRSGYAQHPIQSEAFVCVTPPDHRLAHRDSIRLAELAREDFVHGTAAEWEHFLSYLLPMCRGAGFVPRIVQEAAFTNGILGLVACGMGVSILTSDVIKSVDGSFSVIPITDAPERLQTVAIWKLNQMQGAKARFIDYLQTR